MSERRPIKTGWWTILSAAPLGLVTALVIAAPATAAIKPSADYRFESSFKTSTGALPALHPESTLGGKCPCGKLVKAKVGAHKQGVWRFPEGDGLRLRKAGDALGAGGSVYTIVMLVKLSDVGQYRKLIDFNDRSSDSGIYDYSGGLTPIPSSVTSPPFLVSGGWFQLAFTRDAVGNLKAYGRGVCPAGHVCEAQQPLFSTADTGSDWVLGPQGRLHFLVDDTVSSGFEASGGQIARLRIYNGVLSEQQVAHLGL